MKIWNCLFLMVFASLTLACPDNQPDRIGGDIDLPVLEGRWFRVNEVQWFQKWFGNPETYDPDMYLEISREDGNNWRLIARLGPDIFSFKHLHIHCATTQECIFKSEKEEILWGIHFVNRDRLYITVSPDRWYIPQPQKNHIPMIPTGTIFGKNRAL